MNLLVSNILSALMGIIVDQIFHDPIARYKRKLVYTWRRLRNRLRKPDSISPTQTEYRLGRWQVAWVAIEGSSSDPYTPNNTICQYDPTPLALPVDRQQRKAQIENEQMLLEQTTGRRLYHNGPTLALAGLGRGQIGGIEDPLLILRLRPSDYYTFLATAMSLDEAIHTEEGKATTVRDKYLRSLDYASPMPEFASAFAIQTSMITSDGYFVVSKRAMEGICSYPGYLAPAINECVNPISDRSANGAISLFATTQRGASHELNIEITEDELVFFTVGADTRWYMYTLTGLIRSKSFSRDDILARRSLGCKEHWEATQYYFLAHDPYEVAKFMRDISETERWSPYGVVCLTQALISEFGVKLTERALNKHAPVRRKETYDHQKP